jgi:hypothetical protein
MPLPTTNLTLHLDASDTDNLFTTWGAAGAHTGTPADGNAVQVWRRESDGSLTPAQGVYTNSDTSRSPVYRSTTPLMLLPCLDFDGSNDQMAVCDNTSDTSNYGTSAFYGLSAKFIIFSVYFEAIDSTQAAFLDRDGVIGGNARFMLHARNDGGTRKIYLANEDSGGLDIVEHAVSLATTYVVCMRHDGSSIYLSVDDGAEVSTASGATVAEAAAFVIGRAGGATNFNGRFGEIAVYNSDGTSQKADALAYFRAKWQGVGAPTARIVTPYAAVTF